MWQNLCPGSGPAPTFSLSLIPGVYSITNKSKLPLIAKGEPQLAIEARGTSAQGAGISSPVVGTASQRADSDKLYVDKTLMACDPNHGLVISIVIYIPEQL